MAKQVINLGTMADNKSGDPLRTAFTKINENFDELYEGLGQPSEPSIPNYISSGETAPGSAVVANETSVDVNFAMMGTKFKFKDNGDLQLNGGTVVDQDGNSLLNQGGTANTGDVTFNGVTITGKSLDQIGTQLWIGTDYSGQQVGVNGNGVQVSADIGGIDQVQEGWTITFANGDTLPLITAYYWPNGNFWVLQWADNYTSEASVFPLTVQTSDFRPGSSPELILKADDSEWAQDYGVKVFNSIDNDTHLAPLTREKGVALGFAYGQGSHVRVEGTNGQGGSPGSGDRVGIVAADSEGSSAEWLFNKDGVLVLPPNGDIRDINNNSVLPSSSNTLSTVSLTGGAQLSISTGYPNYGIGGPNAAFIGNVWTGNGTIDNVQVGDTVSNGAGWTATITQVGIYGPGWLTIDQDWFNDPNATYYITGQQVVRTDLDLTKTVQKLTDGEYRVADGQEGQIMYLVQSPNNATGNIVVYFDNARVGLNQYQNIFMIPNNVTTLIFTDGCWQSDNGNWD